MNYFKKWKESHPNLYEFINFNILSNCATITNFVVMWMCTGFVFRQYREIPFRFFIFVIQNRKACSCVDFTVS